MMNQLLPMTREISKFSNVLRRNKTTLDKTRTKEFGDPFCVGDICFASRNILDTLSVGQSDLARFLEYMVNRFPINSRAFHSHVSARSSLKPGPKLM
ncbi:hypothetical protein D3C85_1719590 [compost metagenome]